MRRSVGRGGGAAREARPPPPSLGRGPGAARPGQGRGRRREQGGPGLGRPGERRELSWGPAPGPGPVVGCPRGPGLEAGSRAPVLFSAQVSVGGFARVSQSWLFLLLSILLLFSIILPTALGRVVAACR